MPISRTLSRSALDDLSFNLERAAMYSLLRGSFAPVLGLRVGALRWGELSALGGVLVGAEFLTADLGLPGLP